MGIFKKKFPLENLDFLNKALQVARDSLESGSENEDENIDRKKEDDNEGMISDGPSKGDADEKEKVTGKDLENQETNFSDDDRDR
ncbi:hypothetical protein OWV82_010441 [Melia azedarach]|uniref:Uncharacterized protein n=1 Tax=Melia azedarach TaxID=155640 RepID=A0ACC1Y5L8_MELAZ|nr:hypothetical protein OWV82_010441 [Melia azedarach]